MLLCSTFLAGRHSRFINERSPKSTRSTTHSLTRRADQRAANVAESSPRVPAILGPEKLAQTSQPLDTRRQPMTMSYALPPSRLYSEHGAHRLLTRFDPISFPGSPAPPTEKPSLLRRFRLRLRPFNPRRSKPISPTSCRCDTAASTSAASPWLGLATPPMNLRPSASSSASAARVWRAVWKHGFPR